MSRLFFFLCFASTAAAFLPAHAEDRPEGLIDLYVDANGGDDGNSGFSSSAAKKTLKAIMEIAVSGDTVHAAAGIYDEGEVATVETYSVNKVNYDITVSNRCVVPAGVTLAGAGAGKTIIKGLHHGSATADWQNATDLVRGLNMGSGAALKDVTVTGGGAPYLSTPANIGCFGGGVYSSGNCTFTDCVFTNNIARNGGGVAAANGDVFLRCLWDDNGGGYIASALYGGGYTVVNSRIRCTSSYATYPGGSTTRFVNCTLAGASPLRNVSGGHLYNCYIDSTSWNTGDASTYHNCRFARQADYDAVPAAKKDADTVVGTDIVDQGSNTYYFAQFPAALPEEAGVDRLHSQRIYGGRVDIGCDEYDLRGDLSRDLAAERVTVLSATSNVCETVDKKVALHDGDEIAVSWTSPAAGNNEYSFVAEVTGGGTLSLWLGDAAEPLATVTSADGAKSVSFESSAATLGLRFAYSGDGEGTLCDFQDSISVTIADAGGGFVLDGISLGETLITPGEKLTFTIRRSYDTLRLCTGFMLNETQFVSFDDYPDGWTHTTSNKATSVSVAACYTEAQDFYVDPVNGSDSNCGFKSNLAWRTLAEISCRSNVYAGDVVYALPGMYAERAVGETASSVTSNRVIVPAGVRLVSVAGPEKTFIVGAAAPNPPGEYGLGEGAVRCAMLRADTELVGFTLTGGRTRNSASTSASSLEDRSAGVEAVYSTAYVVDCVVTNCIAGACGIGKEGRWVRCRLVNNRGINFSAGLQDAYLYNCYSANNAGSYCIHYPRAVVNCTLLGSNAVRGNNTSNFHVCNSIVERAVAGLTMHNCAYVSADNSVDCVDCVQVPALSDFGLDGQGRASSDLVRDIGDNSRLDTVPERFRAADFGGGQRVYNGTVDAGCFEHDARPDFSALLSFSGVTVTSASPDVYADDAGHVVMTNASEVALDWASSPMQYTTTYVFNAGVAGDGTLSIFRSGSDEPSWTLTEADGERELSFTDDGDATMRFVFSGGGAARLSRFTNDAIASITASEGGICISGADFGTNYAISQPLHFAVTRVFDSPRLATGFMLNGVYQSWDDWPDGYEHTVVPGDRSTCVSIEVVYAKTGEQSWYVSPRGHDSRSGFLPTDPKKTLADVITNTTLAAGDTIWLMPGVHDQGTMANGADLTLNRAILPKRVNLASYSGSAADTFLVGAPAPEGSRIDRCGGCGTNAVRCIMLTEANCVSNITFCGGYTACSGFQSHSAKNEYFAGVHSKSGSANYLVGCVISNNHSNIDAGTGYATLFRCRISDNVAYWYSSGVAYGRLFGCLVRGNSGAYCVHFPSLVVNCTIIATPGNDALRSYNTSSKVYNSLLSYSTLNSVTSIDFYRCYFCGDRIVRPEEAHGWEDGCVTNGEAVVSYDSATFAPVKGESAQLDAGNAEYLSLYPEAFAAERGLDFYGNPRILGGQIDVGAIEYDWRRDFAVDLGHRMAVPAASSNVVETADRAVRIFDGQSLVAKWGGPSARPRGREFRFAVSDGRLTIRLNGAAVAEFAADGTWRWDAVSADDEIEFAFAATADGGHADILGTRSTEGYRLLLR